jgi:hypothetical protein
MSGKVGDNLFRASGVVAALASDAYDDDQIQSNIAMLGFKVAVNGSLTRYNLVDQSIDEYFDTSGVDASASTNEVRSDVSPYYYFGGSVTTPSVTEDADATGTEGDYTWYKWTDTGATGSYNTDTTQDHEWLLVGGGGGGARAGGGGGAGGYRAGTTLSLIGGNAYTVTVGAGGTGGGASGYSNGTVGGDSILSGTGITTITSAGGGYGGMGGENGGPGGSGGGGGYGAGLLGGHTVVITQYTAAGETRDIQGFDATDSAGTGSPAYGASGGAGTSTEGLVGSSAAGGDGGIGIQNDISSVNTWYGGGGGGGVQNSTAAAGNHGTDPANGRTEGGGGFGDNDTGPTYADATANTGGGGGGSHSVQAGAGGSGIVLLRRETTTTAAGADLTLQSTDVSAETEPDYGEIVLLMEDGEGTATLNTDIKGYISRDSGTTFTQGTFVDEGTWGTDKKVLAFHDLDISAQPSGTSMCYKIETLNQSAGSKETNIYATSIGWR